MARDGFRIFDSDTHVGPDARIIPVPIPLSSDDRATVGGARRAAATADIGFGL